MDNNKNFGRPMDTKSVLLSAIAKRASGSSVMIVAPTGPMARLAIKNAATGGFNGDGEALRLMTFLEPNEKNVITVSSVRESIERLRLSSGGGVKTLLVIGGEYMNANAQAAMLKTLEEPSETTHIIIVTRHAGLVTSTIRSRCIIQKSDGFLESDNEENPALKEMNKNSIIGTLFGKDPDNFLFYRSNNGEAILEKALEEGVDKPSVALSWSKDVSSQTLAAMAAVFGWLVLFKMGDASTPSPILEKATKRWSKAPVEEIMNEVNNLEDAARTSRMPGANAKSLAAESLARLFELSKAR